MKFVVVLLSIGVGVAAFAGMATLGAGPAIDYKTASLEERQEWLEGQKKVISRAAKFFLPNGRGPAALNFYLKDVVTRADAGEIELLIDVKVPYGAKVGRIPKNKFLDTFCKNYINTGLYKQGIKLIANFKQRGGKKKRIARIKVNPSDCRWAEKQA
ncbi:MAG: hypothetical protein AAGA53_17775 [Pseudomonadota bacterium]